VKPVGETPTEPVDYALLSVLYGGLLGAVAVGARARDTEAIECRELLPLGVATFALSRTLVDEKVETWIRRPFVDEEQGRPKGRRLRYAVGELLQCTRCTGTWSALALVGLRVARPTAGRTVTAVLGAAAVNDFLQSTFSYCTAASNRAQQESEAYAANGGPTSTAPSRSRTA
jgi:hypothetical protein